MEEQEHVHLFETATKLHYSQTPSRSPFTTKTFETATKLHYSQTDLRAVVHDREFETATKLHYSQTRLDVEHDQGGV